MNIDIDRNAPESSINRIHNVTFIIPSIPEHYHYVYEFIEPIYKTIDIHIVFSGIEHYDIFREKDKIKPIIMTESYDRDSIITFKKFYGLKYLINSCYDYFIVCDSESSIVLENFVSSNVNNKINDIFKNKIVYGEKTDNGMLIDIMNISNNIFSKEHQEILKKETDNYTLYIWWSNLPVYKKEHLPDFFDKVNYDNINWNHFDYILYQYYLVLYHNFKILNADTSLLTLYLPFTTIEYETNQLNTLDRFNFGFSSINYPLYIRYINYFKQKGTFLVVNLDRQ
jgi:hypothetical protein